MSDIDLRKLADPFHPNDIEWRVARAEIDWCRIVPYLTARAVMERLDSVCGPENWCTTPLSIHEMRVNVNAIQVGVSIRIDDQWVTKYDVSSPTEIEAAKGAYSGAMKRAAVQWGIGRYLYFLTDMRGVISKTAERPKEGYGWKKQTIKGTEKVYWWKPPLLPAWALPRQSDAEQPVTEDQIKSLKTEWRKKFAPTETSRQSLWTGFEQFVHSIDGYSQLPVSELSCWTQKLVEDVKKRIESTLKVASGPSSDVDFG